MADGRRGGGRRRRPLPEIPFDVIEREFTLAAVPETGSPVMGRREGGWYIRVLTGMTVTGDKVTSRFDYFHVADDGEVLKAPYGYAGAYRPGRLVYPGGMAALALRCGGLS